MTNLKVSRHNFFLRTRVPLGPLANPEAFSKVLVRKSGVHTFFYILDRVCLVVDLCVFGIAIAEFSGAPTISTKHVKVRVYFTF